MGRRDRAPRLARVVSTERLTPHMIRIVLGGEVAFTVLTGVLLARLGRDAGTLDPSAPDPVQRPTPNNGQDNG